MTETEFDDGDRQVLLVFLGGLQLAVLPRTLILLLLFLTAFVWTAVLLMMMLAARLGWLRWDVTHSFAFRLAITVFTIILLCAVAQVHLKCFTFLFLLSNLLFILAEMNQNIQGYSCTHVSIGLLQFYYSTKQS